MPELESKARPLRRVGVLAAALLLLVGGRAAAEPPPPADAARTPVTLARAIADGARRGPAVVEAAPAREAASAFARRPGSSLPSAPQVTLLAGARAPANLPTGPEVALTVQQEISARGLGAARRRAAEWASRAASSDLDRARLEGAAAAALAWVDLLEAQELARVRSAAVEDALRLERIAEVKVASGVATAVERSLASAEVGAARLSVLEGEGRETEARIALAHATQIEGSILAAEGVLEPTDERSFDAGAVVRSAGGHPAVQAAEAHARQSSAEASVARAASGPSFAVGATAWREGTGDHAAAAIVSIPLPLFDPARYDTARQTTLAAAASARAARAKLELERELRLALHDREHTREVRTELREGVVAPLRAARATALTSYAAGTTELGVVLLARRSELAAEERLVVGMADVWRADLRLAALTGTLVAGGAR